MNYANSINTKRFPKPYKHPNYKPTLTIGVQHNEEYPGTTHIIIPTKYRTEEKLYTLQQVIQIQKRALFLQKRKADEKAEGDFRRRKKYQQELIETAKNDEQYLKQCQGKGCSVNLLNITTDDKSKYCRKCFLNMHDRDVCIRCKASKKKNEFKICYKCNCELRKLI